MRHTNENLMELETQRKDKERQEEEEVTEELKRSTMPEMARELSLFDEALLIFFLFYFIFKLYIIVLVLPNIKMNPPQVYMCSPS